MAETARRAWWWLTHTLVGRVLIAGAAVKAVVQVVRRATGMPDRVEGLDKIGSALLLVAVAVLGYRLFVNVRQRVLWRVRRKLTLSYVFIGFVPALLLIAFFSISGLLLFFNVGAYMLRERVGTTIERTQFLAQAAAIELGHAATPQEVVAGLARLQADAVGRFPLVSYALAAPSTACGAGSGAPAVTGRAGPWGHTSAPAAVPEWVPCNGYAGLVAGTADGRTWAAARGVAWLDRAGSKTAVVVDVPLGDALLSRIAAETGVTVRRFRTFEQAEGPFRSDDAASTPAATGPRSLILGPINIPLEPDPASGSSRALRWAALMDFTAWDTGRTDSLFLEFGLGLRAVYEHLSVFPVARLADFNFARVLLIVLAVVGALFLIILAVAALMGFALARSITGAVHELFVGTERVRGGDFSHKVLVRSRDQLGELADSFNSMTDSIEHLLVQKAQKDRLEQELSVARDIQMSLLPQGPLVVGGVSFSGHCEPARHVGGDYYDFWAIDDHRFGMLIADVAGKGTSAALYMAELKGIMMSLSQSHNSPRQLLIDANRIISRHLDARSFITMTYGVVDIQAATLTYARAGHCPLIRLPGSRGAMSVGTAEVLAPDGMVLGLKLDDGQIFERLLVEATLSIGPGDVFLLYTDGVTEAMNASGEFFGEARLSALVESHGHLPFPDVRDQILSAVTSFAGAAEQQDDITMLLLQVQGIGQAAH